jgi:hypothetical protein
MMVLAMTAVFMLEKGLRLTAGSGRKRTADLIELVRTASRQVIDHDRGSRRCLQASGSACLGVGASAFDNAAATARH